VGRLTAMEARPFVPPGCGSLSEGLMPATRHTPEGHGSGPAGSASLAASAMGTGRRANHHSRTSPGMVGIRESDLTIPVVTEDQFHVRTLHLAIHRSRLQAVPGQQPPRFAGAPLSHRPRADGASIWARRPVPIVYRTGSAEPRSSTPCRRRRRCSPSPTPSARQLCRTSLAKRSSHGSINTPVTSLPSVSHYDPHFIITIRRPDDACPLDVPEYI
jgi:hypothetical protein